MSSTLDAVMAAVDEAERLVVEALQLLGQDEAATLVTRLMAFQTSLQAIAAAPATSLAAQVVAADTAADVAAAVKFSGQPGIPK